MLSILMGALGGMAAKGILGMFVGATLLALGYQIFMGWVHTNPDARQCAERHYHCRLGRCCTPVHGVCRGGRCWRRLHCCSVPVQASSQRESKAAVLCLRAEQQGFEQKFKSKSCHVPLCC